MPPESAIIFDLDDTLFAERDYAFSGFNAVAAEFEQVLQADVDLAARMRALFDTPNRTRVFNTIVEECGMGDDESLVPRMIEVFRNHRPAIQLHADADAALSRLRPDYKLGIITDGYAVTQHAKLDALHVRPRVDLAIVTDDWGREFWKPHPRAFEEMASRLQVPPRSCTYVADNPAKDFIAPNTLGWRTIQIERPDAVHAANATAENGAPHRKIVALDEL